MLDGALVLDGDAGIVIVPAVVLTGIAEKLAAQGAPIQQGILLIESGSTRVKVLLVSLGDVTLTASELGDYIQFTLNIPGFESNSLKVELKKQTPLEVFWTQVGIIGTLVAVGFGTFWWFVAGKRRRKDKEDDARLSQIR